MDVIWRLGEATVAQVRGVLERTHGPAYTTVMTVMSRLAEKGMLRRQKRGRAYLYRPVAERAEVAGSILSNVVERLYSGSSSAAIAHLIETREDVSESELERLEQLIRERRRRHNR